MTPQEFLDEFGTLAESAEGVPKLRELVLELAVRGKLVVRRKSVPANDPAGIPAISRLSEATPPGRVASNAFVPEGVTGDSLRPLRGRWSCRDRIPGCAARPGANRCDPFGMKTVHATFIAGGAE